MDTTTLAQRKTALADTVGQETNQIATISFDIAKMRSLGVLVDIDIHGASMFTARATWADWEYLRKTPGGVGSSAAQRTSSRVATSGRSGL